LFQQKDMMMEYIFIQYSLQYYVCSG